MIFEGLTLFFCFVTKFLIAFVLNVKQDVQEFIKRCPSAKLAVNGRACSTTHYSLQKGSSIYGQPFIFPLITEFKENH